MWSLGAIVAELFLGLPLFPGENEYNQLHRIITMRGPPPDEMLDAASFGHKFFVPKTNGEAAAPAAAEAEKAAAAPAAAAPTAGAARWELKDEETFARENGVAKSRNKKYFKYSTLPDLITKHPPLKPPASADEEAAERSRREAMLSFVDGLLTISPSRWMSCTASIVISAPGSRTNGRSVRARSRR